MPDIYSTEWYDALKDLMNRNPDLAKSAPSGELNVLGVFEGDGRSPYLEQGEQRRSRRARKHGYGGSAPPRPPAPPKRR